MSNHSLSILGLIFLMTSCTDNKTQTENKAENATIIETAKLDTGIVKIPEIPDKKKVNTVFPPGTFNSYPQIVKSLFGEGSSMEEVLVVMGKPELIETPQQGVEVWYYGNTEVQFKYKHVYYVVNPEQCKKFVKMSSLLISHDPIEKKFGQHLLESASKYSNYN